MERLGTNAFLSALGDWTSGPGSSLHRKLEGAVRQAVETGLLRTGVVLPAERTMARSLGVSRSTVTIALNDLRADGVLVSRHGSGTSVAPASLPTNGATRRAGASADPDPRAGGPTGERGGSIDLAASSPADARALPQVDVDIDALLLSGPRHGYTPAGLPELRRGVAERFTLDGLPTTADQVLITNGAQHALALAFSELTQPGDAIVVDDPTYPGVIDLLAARRLRPIPLPRTGGGVDPEAFGSLVERTGARLAYLQTLVHNPTGRCADPRQLGRLAEVVDATGITLLEDLVLSDLRFDGERIAPVAARVVEAATVVVGSVSKLGWGGLRIGWLRADSGLVDRLVRSRLTDDLGSSIPSQVISVAVLNQFAVIAESRQRSLGRRAALASALLAEHCPAWSVQEPAGGLSLWITLDGFDADHLAELAAEEGVVIATGGAASVSGDDGRHIQLCFDRPEQQLTEGIARLARAAARRNPPGPPDSRARSGGPVRPSA